MFGWRFWSLSFVFTIGATLLIGIPTVLIPNPLFERMTPTGLQDYLIWGISAALVGPLLALAVLYPTAVRAGSAVRVRDGGARAIGGGLLSFLSVGCPICNKVVVLLLGISGAMTFFNPLRPFLGIASIILLSVTLFLRVKSLRHGCPVNFEGISTTGK